MQRHLAAILAAGVVGYSALVEQDKEGSLARVISLWREILVPKINDHHGRVVKTDGDGILIEFPNPLATVRCAAAIQASLAAWVAEEPSRALTSDQE